MATTRTDQRIADLEARKASQVEVLEQYQAGVADLESGSVVEYQIGDTRYRKSEISQMHIAIAGAERTIANLESQLSMLYNLKQSGGCSVVSREACT